MKKLISAVLCVVLMLTIIPACYAETPAFDLTKSIMDEFDDDGYKYTFHGYQDDDKEVEKITISFSGDYIDSMKFTIFVKESTNRISILCYDVISYNDKDFSKVLRAVNRLNYDYNFAKFYCDDTDDTVTAEWVGYGYKDTAGEMVGDIIHMLGTIIDEAYNDVLGTFDK